MVLSDRQVNNVSDNPSHPLVLRFGGREVFDRYGKTLLDADTQKYVEMKENGQNGRFICGVAHYTPEYDQIDPETGTQTARGWRSLALLLVNKGICSLARAQRVFGCSSLGEARYDKMTYEQKLADVRKDSGHAF